MDFFWTKDKPTKPGWYWQSKWNRTSEGIVPVRYYVDVLCIGNYPLPDNDEWCGPIPKPTHKLSIKRVLPSKTEKIKRIRLIPTLMDKIMITPDGEDVYGECQEEGCMWRGLIKDCDIGTEQEDWESTPYEIPICPICGEPVDY